MKSSIVIPALAALLLAATFAPAQEVQESKCCKARRKGSC